MVTDDAKNARLRAEYQENLEAQLDKVDVQIRELGIQSSDLNDRYHAAQAALRELSNAPDATWEGLKTNVDNLFFELNQALDEASPQSP
jgi:hypothetical protein